MNGLKRFNIIIRPAGFYLGVSESSHIESSLKHR